MKKISTEIAALCEAEKDTTTLAHLRKCFADNQLQHTNSINAIMECSVDSIRQTLYKKVQKLEMEQAEIEKQITIESAVLPTLTKSKIKFFLTSLKKGDVNDIKYRKSLIAAFVNSTFLYDNRITITFNSGDVACYD